VDRIYSSDFASPINVTQKQPGRAKILVGDPSIESGVTIGWLQAAVSDGKGWLTRYAHNGAVSKSLENLPEWRLTQQEGRLNRVEQVNAGEEIRPGSFTLLAEAGFQDKNRPISIESELKRLPLTKLILRCATLNLNPLELKFDVDIRPEALLQAGRQLENLGLINKDWQLTEAGQDTYNNSVSHESGAMLWEAKKKGLLAHAIPLAAINDVDGLRPDPLTVHTEDPTCALLSDIVAFNNLSKEPSPINRSKMMTSLGVSRKRYENAKILKATLEANTPRNELRPGAYVTDEELKELLLVGGLNRLMLANEDGSYSPVLQPDKSYKLWNTDKKAAGDTRFALCDLFESIAGNEMRNVTFLTDEDILRFAGAHEKVFSDAKFERDYNNPDKVDISYLGSNKRITFDVPAEISDPPYSQIFPGFWDFMDKSDAADLVKINGAIGEPLRKRGIELRIAAYSEEPSDSDWIKASTPLLNPETGKEALNGAPLQIEIKPNSLSAGNLGYLLEHYPQLLPRPDPEKAADYRHAVQIEGNKVTIYAADEYAWQKSSLPSLAEELLAPGQTLAIEPAIVMNPTTAAQALFPQVYVMSAIGEWCNNAELSQANDGVNMYKEATNLLALKPDAGKVALLGGEYPEGMVLIPESKIGELDDIKSMLVDDYLRMEERINVSKEHVASAEEKLAKAGFTGAQIGASFAKGNIKASILEDPVFYPRLDAALTIHQIAEEEALKLGLHLTADNLSLLADTARLGIRLPSDTKEEVVVKWVQAIEEKAEAAGIILDKDISGQPYIILNVDEVDRSKAPDDLQSAIQTRIEKHQEFFAPLQNPISKQAVSPPPTPARSQPYQKPTGSAQNPLTLTKNGRPYIEPVKPTQEARTAAQNLLAGLFADLPPEDPPTGQNNTGVQDQTLPPEKENKRG
jgi:hypothetical protein